VINHSCCGKHTGCSRSNVPRTRRQSNCRPLPLLTDMGRTLHFMQINPCVYSALLTGTQMTVLRFKYDIFRSNSSSFTDRHALPSTIPCSGIFPSCCASIAACNLQLAPADCNGQSVNYKARKQKPDVVHNSLPRG
jgi:hypothetical protein